MFLLLVFKGIQKTTLIDFPKQVACTLFLPKCNFKCPFCYNPQLVLNKDTGTSITEKQVFEFLEERKGFLDGVCVTGGEPLLHPNIIEFCKKLKQKGFLVKIDTNGTFPEILQKLIEEKAVDYIAMDIKNTKEKYNKTTGIKADLEKIEKSIALIKKSSIEYEFRITVVPELHSKQDLLEIGKWLKGSKQFFLQQFNPTVPLLDKSLEESKTYQRKELNEFAKELKPFFGKIAVREV